MKDVLEALVPLVKTPQVSWMPMFEKYNIHRQTQPIYDAYDITTANSIIAYALFAYSQESTWLRLHQDRLQNKIEIMLSIVGGEWPVRKVLRQVIENSNEIAERFIQFVLDQQKDWRFAQIETYKNYQAHMRMMASSLDLSDPKGSLDKGKALDEGRKRRMEADVLEKQVEQDYSILNSSLEQEGRQKLAGRPSSQLSWEDWIRSRDGHDQEE